MIIHAFNISYFYALRFQRWVWGVMLVAPPSHGKTAWHQVTLVRMALTCAAKCTSRTPALNLSGNTAFLKLDAVRTPTLPVKMPLDRSSAKLTAVPLTTAMPVQLSMSVVSCCWHAPWHIWWLLPKLETWVNTSLKLLLKKDVINLCNLETCLPLAYGLAVC